MDSQLERDVTTTKEILRLPPVSAIFDRMQAEKRAQEREALAKACEEARSLMQLGVDFKEESLRSFFQAKMKVYYQTVIDGVASVVREARELLMARKKDSDQSLADVANRRFVVDRVLPKAERHWHWQTCFFLDLTSIGDGLEAVDMCISSSPCCHRGWLGWLAGWLACLPACLLACCLARMLGCSVACLLPCLACLLAGWLACLLPAWLACLLTCLLASLCARREG